MRRVGGTVLLVLGFLACPCHLIITLPLLVSLFTGTVVGSFLKQNPGLVYTGASISFVVALALGVSLSFGPKGGDGKRDAACPSCIPLDESEPKSWPARREDAWPLTRS